MLAYCLYAANQAVASLVVLHGEPSWMMSNAAMFVEMASVNVQLVQLYSHAASQTFHHVCVTGVPGNRIHQPLSPHHEGVPYPLGNTVTASLSEADCA